MPATSSHAGELNDIKQGLAELPNPFRRDVHAAAHSALRVLRDEDHPARQVLAKWKNDQDRINSERYGTHVYSGKALQVEEVKPVYSDQSPTMMGFEVVNAGFDALLARDDRADRLR